MIDTGRRRRLTTRVVGALALALGAAGCGGGGDQSSPTLPPLSAAPSSATGATTPRATSVGSPSTDIAAGPPPHTAFTRAGAEQFVRAYYATANQALMRGRPTPFDRYLLPTCDCDNVLPVLRQLEKKHQHFVGQGYRLTDVAVTAIEGAGAVVRTTFSLPSMPLLDGEGRRVNKSNDVHRQTNQLVLIYRTDRWYVEKILIGRPR